MDPGTKMGLGRTKNKSAHNLFKKNVCVGLVITNPTQLEQAQMDTICEIYRDLFVFPNRQNFVDCTVHKVLTWQLTIQVVQLYNDVVGTVSC